MKSDFAKKIISLIDLTSLNDSDTEETITALCQKANTALGSVAAVCVYPQFVKLAKSKLQNTPVKIATVANFPHGKDSLENVLSSIQQSIQDGADEIDVVFPYEKFLQGEVEFVVDFIRACKKICGKEILLKVILETGALKDSQIISAASVNALKAGADFIKTSTGKTAAGATPEAATVMLVAIKEMTEELHRSFGFKASGGVRTIEQAKQYLTLADKIMGPDWVTPKTFRLGASQLLDVVLVSF